MMAESVNPTMESSIGQRIFTAHLELSYRLGRRVTLAEFGRLIAKRLGRAAPFAPTAVSKWEAGLQTPTPEVIEAIADVAQVDPGWISHGEKSAAPPPRGGLAQTDIVQLPAPPSKRAGDGRGAGVRGRGQARKRR